MGFMSLRWRISAGFAVLGVIVAGGLLAYSYYTSYHHIIPNQDVFLWLCPSSIFSMAIGDGSTVATAFLVWSIIGLTNAMLYGIVGAIISLLVPKTKSVA
jgi:hypothetical protein